MAKKIRDTIHGYIYLTRLEEAVSQHELVLRLHYIHQTSFTFLTYPNAHSTRYPHSLGVMHVAGEIFQSALLNTPVAVLRNVAERVSGLLGDERLKAVREEFELTQRGDSPEPLYEGVDRGRSQRATGSPDVPVRGDNDLFLPLVILFQGTRLAAMLHDVGHPPFSHIVEYALLQAAPKDYPGHEHIGLELVHRIRTDGVLDKRSIMADAPLFSAACLDVCEAILKAKDGTSVFAGLKDTLLSGPIDADRLDYVRRDAYSAGLVPTYDIRRMVDAAFFRLDQSDGKMEVAYRPNCLSSFENFFLARSDLYRYMIYHHDVVRRNLSVQKAMAMLIGSAAKLPKAAKAVGKQFLELATGNGRDDYGQYRSFNDATLLNMLWQVDDLVRDRDGGDTTDERELKLFLHVVLRRRNDLLRTLLKRPDDYAKFAGLVAKGLQEESSEPVPWFNNSLRAQLERLKADGHEENVAKFHMASELEAKMNQAARARMPGQEVSFHCYYSGTFNAGPKRRVAFSDPSNPDVRTVAEDISPTVDMLDRAWNFSPHLLVFFHTPGVESPSRGREQGDILRFAAVDGVVDYLGQQ